MVIDDNTIRLPLDSYRVAGIDEPLIRAILPVHVRTASRQFQEVTFTVDSASSITSMSAGDARKSGIVVPRRAIEVGLETATGSARQIRRPGRIQVKVLGLDQWQFDWPCHFVEHEGPALRSTLGLSGVLDDLIITLDGSYSIDAPYGWLILKRQE
jgi:hypothetical protein